MSHEMLVRVDDDDTVIGIVSREEAHQDSDIVHREVGLLIADRDGKKVMFSKRALSKSVLPGWWSTGVAGHVEVINPATADELYESPDQTIIRETSEEIGAEVQLDQLAYLGKEKYVIEDNYRSEAHFKYWYVFIVENPTTFLESLVLKEDEVEEVDFWSLPDIREHEADEEFLLYEPFLRVVKMYLDENIENYLIQKEGDSDAKSYS